MMRRLLVLMALILVSTTNSPLFAVVPYPFFDGFESGNYNSWTNGTSSFTRQVTSTTAASGTYSFSMTGGSSSHRQGVSAQFATAQAPTTVSFSVRSNSTSRSCGYFVLGPSSSNPVFCFFRSSGTIYVNRDETFRYQANTWYTIRLELDWANNNLDYYINGNLIKTNVTFE